MTDDLAPPPPADGARAPTVADFDEVFSAAAASPGLRRVWELAEPDLPAQVEPHSFDAFHFAADPAIAPG